MTAAVTGWAWRTPLGVTVDDAVARLLAGERAAQPNPRFPAASYACTLAAAVPAEPRPSRHRKFLRRMGLLAVEAAAEALAMAGVGGGDRLGLFFGYGGLRAHWDDFMPALARQEPDAADAWARGLKLLHPFWMLHHLSNNAHALLAIDLGARGDGLTLGGANAGAQALAAAERALAAGSVDAALVVAYDSLVEPETLVELGARGAATAAGLADLAAPYDERAAGFVPGEAAAALVLARDGGFGRVTALDAADGSPGEPAPALLAELAARLAARGAPVVDGAAIGRQAFDDAERAALAGVVGPGAPLTATLAATGHVGGAAAVVQAIALLATLRRGVVAPVAGLARPAPGPLVPAATARPTEARAGLALSAGAPGLAGAVLVEVA
jgi:3-oxoacyl-[acyl-carrier-protein] synthase I